MGDGTFKCCPSIFLYQVYIISALNNQSGASRIFALLPNKSDNCYERLFSKIKQLPNDYQPQNMLCDFEMSQSNSFSKSFEKNKIGYCLLYLAKNVYSNVKKRGYKVQYSEDSNFSLKIRCLVALAALPVSDVVEGFEKFI